MANILAVDDSPSIRQLVAMTLKGGGHTVKLAENGIGALDIAKHYAADLVIPDVHMPTMDGITCQYDMRGVA